jgi:hypothetical protein
VSKAGGIVNTICGIFGEVCQDVEASGNACISIALCVAMVAPIANPKVSIASVVSHNRLFVVL